MIIDRLGPEDYNATLDTQFNLRDAKINDPSQPDALIFVEHESVYTAGRGSLTSDFILKESSGEPEAIRCIEISRGGKVTYHGPGQIVAYPIFNLENHGKDVHVFLRKLEDVIISTLSCYGIRGERRDGMTGVWVETGSEEYKKIASIGIGVKRWVSYHGISINVNPDLSYFEAINPCGFDGKLTTSIAELVTDNTPTLEEVKSTLLDRFKAIFSLHVEEGELVSGLKRRARPSWLRVKAPGSPSFIDTHSIVKEHKLVTVCEEAKCPNMGECWTHGTATFMIMGELCTRRCSFCSVKDGSISNLEPLDPFEPLRVSQAVSRLGLKHVVITSVNRDDVEDMGAAHFDQTIRSIKKLNPDCDVEFLIPDMRGRRELVEGILKSRLLKVLNHNVETVPRLYKTVRPGADFQRSLNVLMWAKEIDPKVKTKSGLMVGLGEEKEEVLEVLHRMKESKIDIVTIGQYLQPTAKQLPIYRFVTPDEFKEYEIEAMKLGFSHVESGPLVRSSYHAWKHTHDLDAPRESLAAS